MKRLSLVVLVQVLIPMMCYAQANFFKGYTITNTGDTIKGYVQVREREINPQFLRFKKELNGESQLISIGESIGYGADMGDVYERHHIEMSMSSIKGSITTGIDTAKQSSQVFLKVLAKGENVALYSLTDEIKERFYIKESSAVTPVELSMQVFYSPEEPTKLVTQSKYRNQLLMLTRKYDVNESEERKLEKLNYEKSDLVMAINLINHSAPSKSQLPVSRFFVGGGLYTAGAKYDGLATKSLNKLPLGLFVKGGLDLYANPATGKLIFRVEFAVSTISVKAASSYFRNNFTQTSLTLTPQVIQNIYNAPNTKVFIGAGFEANVPFYGDNVMVIGPQEGEEKYFEPVYFSIPLVAGLVLNKKIELSIGHSPYSRLTKRVHYPLLMEKYRIGINYIFAK